MGSIVQINVSQGGVPKTPISEGIVTVDGIMGDRQADLRFHGGPDRALCLWSQEIINALRNEGHPVDAGTTGENVTVTGIDWSKVLPGVQLKLGDTVRLEITDYAPPCRTIAQSFLHRRHTRINQKKYPGQSRVYARILSEGTIRPGDEVEVDSSQ
jgi:MOSC domain-containing protein YiiM